MYVVNLFGAPGSGKSTGMAYVFAKLKLLGVKVELVTEFAKDLVYGERIKEIKHIPYVFGNQSLRLAQLVGSNIDVAITDSPLLCSIFYNKDPIARTREKFRDYILTEHERYNNINFFVERKKPYYKGGRLQTEAESDALAAEILTSLRFLLPTEGINVVPGTEWGYASIVEQILKEINNG